MIRSNRKISSRYCIAALFSFFYFGLNIRFFAGPFALAVYAFSQAQCAWLGLLTGLYLDIVYDSVRFGFYGTSYMLAILIAFRYRKFLFQDNSTSYTLMAYFFSFIVSLVEGFLAFILEIPSPIFSFSWVMSDCVIMPLLDALVALLMMIEVPRVLFLKKFSRTKRIKKSNLQTKG